MNGTYYNEWENFPCDVIRKNIKLGNLPDGKVDERDIRDVRPEDLAGFRQLHLFAGIGGAALACRIAGAEHVNLWTFGFPCQDISTAGKGAGLEGERSGLFFEVVRLLEGSVRRPDWLLVENVPALRTRGADAVLPELEELGYACRASVVGAWSVGAPHKRERVWIVGNSRGERSLGGSLSADGEVHLPEAFGPGEGHAHGADSSSGKELGHTEGDRGREWGLRIGGEQEESITEDSGSLGFIWPARPGDRQRDWEEPRLVELPVGGAVDGVSVRLVRANNRNALKAYGNSWVPQCAVPFLRWIAWADGQLKEGK